MKRHIGKITSTDQRVLVAFMQIPNRETHALLITADALPPRIEQAVMDILESPEGQNEETLANILSRRLMPDTGINVFQTLHESNMLMAMPVQNVVMLPMPNMPVPLSKVLESMGRLSAATVAQQVMGEDTFSAHAQNAQAANRDDMRQMAKNLIAQALLLEQDAAHFRERAYATDPTLRPAKPSDVAKPKAEAAPVAAEEPKVAPVEEKKVPAKPVAKPLGKAKPAAKKS